MSLKSLRDRFFALEEKILEKEDSVAEFEKLYRELGVLNTDDLAKRCTI